MKCRICKEFLTEQELKRGTCDECEKAVTLTANKGQAKRRTDWAVPKKPA